MPEINLNLQISFLVILVADLFKFILYFNLCKLELTMRSIFMRTFILELLRVSKLFGFVV